MTTRVITLWQICVTSLTTSMSTMPLHIEQMFGWIYWWVVGNLPGSRANNLYSPGSDKLTEEHLCMSSSCQLGSRVIRAFSDVEKPFFISDLAVSAAKSENKRRLFSVREGFD